MSIRDTYPFREATLARKISYIHTAEDDTSEIRAGLLLAKRDWLDIRRHENGIDVTVNTVINGMSRAVDEYEIPNGVMKEVGRLDYPMLAPEVSRSHVVLGPTTFHTDNSTKIGIEIIDISTNGTSLWCDTIETTSGRTDQDDTNTHDFSSAKETKSGDRPVDSGLIELDVLVERYGNDYPSLTLIDFGILNNIMKSHPDVLTSRSEKMKLIRMIHPDRNITGDAGRSHELYLLALQILNIRL